MFTELAEMPPILGIESQTAAKKINQIVSFFFLAFLSQIFINKNFDQILLREKFMNEAALSPRFEQNLTDILVYNGIPEVSEKHQEAKLRRHLLLHNVNSTLIFANDINLHQLSKISLMGDHIIDFFVNG